MVEVSWIILSMFLWFNTDFFISYCQFLRLGNRFWIPDWKEYRKINSKIKYLEYIRIKHTNFFTKLISCKPCLNFWITIIFCIIFQTLFLFPFYYLLSYIAYNLINKYIL